MKLKSKKLLWLLSVLVVPVTYGGLAITGSLEPTGAPGPTMRTLEELQPAWGIKIPDASKRFQLVLDGAAVLDKETGLVWEKSPDTSTRAWTEAVDYAYKKEVGGRNGWRFPTVEELASLVDTTQSNPSLPSGHPFTNVQFTNVQSDGYWSSTTVVGNAKYPWSVYFGHSGGVIYGPRKSTRNYVWCVRGGHGHDAY